MVIDLQRSFDFHIQVNLRTKIESVRHEKRRLSRGSPQTPRILTRERLVPSTIGWFGFGPSSRVDWLIRSSAGELAAGFSRSFRIAASFYYRRRIISRRRHIAQQPLDSIDQTVSLQCVIGQFYEILML